MAIAGKLLRAIVYAAAKVGVKKIAYAGGSPFGVGTLAEGAVDFSISFIEDVCKSFGGSSRENAARLPIDAALDPAAQRELKTQIAETAQASAEQTQAEMIAAIDEIAPTLPDEQREQLLADREALVAYAAMLPDRVRRTLQRADDPTGRTLPDGKEIRTPLDLAEFLPPMPRFRPGDSPVYNRRLVRVLGVGTFGEVWEATKVGMHGKRVALKFCLADDAALIHEARLAQRLDHPGIVQLLEVHPRASHPQCGDVPICLEYEFVDSVDLAAWALSQPAPTETWAETVAGVIAELAEIVHVAHAHTGDDGRAEPIVHRDLKPANVLVPRVARGAGRFKVTDFGIGAIVRAAETAQHATVKRTLTRYGSSYTLDALGSHTPKYAPDEQIAGGKPDPRNDVHALGVIWYQMLRRDFSLSAPRGGGWKRQLRAMGVGDGHVELIERCVDSDPGERPTNGGALASDIRRASGEYRAPAGANSEGTGGTPMLPNSPIIVPATPKLVAPAKKEIIEATFPMTAEQARAVQAAAAKALGVPVQESLDLGNGVKLEMMLIPAGEFMMGSPESELKRSDDEGPQHRVRISKPLRVGKFQVTQAQWQAVMGNNPSLFKAAAESTGIVSGIVSGIARALSGSTPPKPVDFGNHPVEQVSWDDCQEFCGNVSRQLGREIRLLTEAQWEYACRSGTATPFHFGATISPNQANYDGNDTYANGSKGEYRQKTTPVGSFPANGWGLHDMHGNVWEWCASWFGPYEVGDKVDPTDSGRGSVRVLRGGSWLNYPRNCRSAVRNWYTPGSRFDSYGFRVASGTT